MNPITDPTTDASMKSNLRSQATTLKINKQPTLLKNKSRMNVERDFKEKPRQRSDNRSGPPPGSARKSVAAGAFEGAQETPPQ